MTSISTPTDPTGQGVVQCGGSGTSFTKFNGAINIPAGSLAIVFVDNNWGGVTVNAVQSISDGTNSYVFGNVCGPTSGTTLTTGEMWYAENAAAVTAGTLTVTMTTGSAVGFVAMANVGGITSPNSLDVNNTAQGSSTTPSVATGALAQTDEIVFGFVVGAANSTVTEDTGDGFTNFVTIHVGGRGFFNVGWKIVSSTAAQTYAPTISPTSTWAISASPFKGAISYMVFQQQTLAIPLITTGQINIGVHS